MSEIPQLLRRSARNRGVPRHPDSPVSYAPSTHTTVSSNRAVRGHSPEVVTISDSSSDSDSDEENRRHIHDDLVRDLQVGIEADALQQASDAQDSMAPEDVEEPEGTVILETPSPDVFSNPGREPISGARVNFMLEQLRADLDEDSDEEEVFHGSITIDGVDSGEGPYQERADRLIQQIVALQQRNPANILQSPSPPVSPPRIAPAQTTAVSMPSSVYGPQGFGMLRVTGIQERSGAQRCVYFVGIQTLESCRTFCQIRAFVDSDANDGAIFRRLQLAGGPVGRALGAITDRAVFFVGTSDYPIDIAQDYANYQFNFREIASLRDVETSNEGDNPFFPVPISAASSTLLRSQNMDETTPVYVLYVYHQDADPRRAPVPENLLPSATFLLPSVVAAMAPPTPFPDDLPDLIAEPPLLQSPQTVSEYLLARFSAEYSQLAVWRACAYGSAYIHCLTERQILRICQSLNIGLLGRTHSPAIIGSMVIRMEDVVATAGINFQTFSTYRTELRLIKEVHVILRRLQRLDALPIAHLPLLDCLEVMLGERIISADATRPVAGSDSVAEAEFSVVRLTIASLMTQVRSIIENFSNV